MESDGYYDFFHALLPHDFDGLDDHDRHHGEIDALKNGGAISASILKTIN